MIDSSKTADTKAVDVATPTEWPVSYYEDPENRNGPLRHDIETYSPEDLTECGVYVYSAHPDFDILLCAFAYGDGPVEVLDLASGQPFPPWLEDDLKNPAVTKAAYNAMFERTCWSSYFHTYIPPTGWVCTMIQAASVSYPFSLEKCGEALGTDVQKDKRGKDLIKLFSIDEQVAEIVISDHYCGNNNITVKWKDGTETTVPSKAKRPWETPDAEVNEEYIPPVRGPRTVRKIKAER